MKINCEIIGKVDSGDVSKISMENNNGVVISTLTTGATLQEFLVPTETGALKNIVLGFSDTRITIRITYVPASPLVGLLEELGKLRILIIWFFIAFLRMREKTVYMAVQKECRFKIGTMSQT